MDNKRTRIKHALYLQGWSYETGNTQLLRAQSTRVLVTEYARNMDGALFCPVCCTNLTRTPKDKLLFSNGRKACFSHIPSYKEIECDLRSTKPIGKNFFTEEEAQAAIANDELVVIKEFLAAPPDSTNLSAGDYDQTPIEDVAGPISSIPMGRHVGEAFALPTRLSTVNSLCRNFDQNLYRYFIFPNRDNATRLVDELINIQTVVATDETPRLYFGKIKSSFNAGPTPRNLRMTELHSNSAVKDFYLKDTDSLQTEKGISKQSTNRFLLVWGSVTENGIGLSINRPKWGEYALLPEKYNVLLEDI